ncbi:DUF4164 family protein [Limibaculum sp. M0105]|uniref:DUF4164 family protein n=1 Tax=Thermohalobaculum xanthum TaxID=2753746 RepID=A0A8J7M455_9RHOB|nr:DUF4164 family protein [Thermohalobaculum xanthum]MBK0398016.1 DUF4164 family protein [Thermohalobaculum xanthum]
MAKLEEAVGRLTAALEQLERAVGDSGSSASGGEAGGRIAALVAERDRLAAEVERLERQVAEDAELRTEAAEAVRAALGDLRAVAGEQGGRHG